MLRRVHGWAMGPIWLKTTAGDCPGSSSETIAPAKSTGAEGIPVVILLHQPWTEP